MRKCCFKKKWNIFKTVCLLTSQQISHQSNSNWKAHASEQCRRGWGLWDTWDLVLPQLVVLVGLLHRFDGRMVDLPQPLKSTWSTRNKHRKKGKTEEWLLCAPLNTGCFHNHLFTHFKYYHLKRKQQTSLLTITCIVPGFFLGCESQRLVNVWPVSEGGGEIFFLCKDRQTCF